MKHSLIDDEGLSMAINVASKLDEQEKIQKAKDIAEGRRSELDDLPPGHPLLMTMENAKQRMEKKQETIEEIKRMKEKQEIRKSKKAKKIIDQQNRDQEEKTHKQKEFVKTINSEIDRVSSEIENFGRLIQNAEKEYELIGVNKVRIVRLKRMLLAVYRGVRDSYLS